MLPACNKKKSSLKIHLNFLFKYSLDRRTKYPTFNLTGARIHDIKIVDCARCMSLRCSPSSLSHLGRSQTGFQTNDLHICTFHSLRCSPFNHRATISYPYYYFDKTTLTLETVAIQKLQTRYALHNFYDSKNTFEL